MKRKAFISRAKKYAKVRNIDFLVDKSRGNGGHTMIKLGKHRTTVKSGEIGTGLLNTMLKQLEICKEDF